MYRDSVRFSDPNIKYVIYIFSISEDDGLETVIDNAKRKEEFGYPEIGDYYNMTIIQVVNRKSLVNLNMKLLQLVLK